jgi:hypothetical protein
MPQISKDLSYRVLDQDGRAKNFQDFDDALALATKCAAGDGKTHSVHVMAKTAKGAAIWGGEEAIIKFKNKSAGNNPLAVVYVKASISYWE